ncbi:MAG TPA: hypothetical protein VEJ63_16615 [Planctomycetota bacterium]|nr:hypothetical protein [Planctomycetota bacterium]
MRVPVIVQETAGVERINEPVRVGVPVPRGVLKGRVSARRPDSAVQAEVLAHWGDDSAKWVLLDLTASCGAYGNARIEVDLAGDGGSASPVPNQSVKATQYNNNLLSFALKTATPFLSDLKLAGASLNAGLEVNLVTTDGKSVTPAAESIEVESAGPTRQVWRLKFQLPAGLERPLVADVRVTACAGFPALLIETTLTNPNPSVREVLGRWPLGSKGAAYLKSFGLRLTNAASTSNTYTADLDDVFVTADKPIRIEQESSGGLHWDIRTHIDRHGNIPQRHCGYRILSGAETLRAGFRAEAFLEMKSSGAKLGVGIHDFWQNFPVALDSSGAIEFFSSTFGKGEHELQGGEAKTWSALISLLPADATPEQSRRMQAACIAPLTALPAVELLERSRAVCPVVRRDDERRPSVERAAIAMIRDPRTNAFTQREMIDEYGWRNYGDLWADNERGCKGAPRESQPLISHYNQEYDWGFGMLLQSLRNAGVDNMAAADFLKLAAAALRHEADIDTYHCWTRETVQDGVYCGGHYTHTAHGVEPGDGSHRGSPTDKYWANANWPWGRGGGPESGHFHTRGQWLLYYLTGSRRHLDSAIERTECVAYKLETNKFHQCDNAGRDSGHNLQVLLDAWQGTGDDRYLRLAGKVVEFSCFAKTYEAVLDKNPGCGDFSNSIHLREYVRFLEALADRGQRDSTLWKQTLDSTVAYLDAVAKLAFVDAEHGLADTRANGQRAKTIPPRSKDHWNIIPQNGWFADVFAHAAEYVPDAERRERYREMARVLFDIDQRTSQGNCPTPIYRNAKVATAFCRSSMVAATLLGL